MRQLGVEQIECCPLSRGIRHLAIDQANHGPHREACSVGGYLPDPARCIEQQRHGGRQAFETLIVQFGLAFLAHLTVFDCGCPVPLHLFDVIEMFNQRGQCAGLFGRRQCVEALWREGCLCKAQGIIQRAMSARGNQMTNSLGPGLRTRAVEGFQQSRLGLIHRVADPVGRVHARRGSGARPGLQQPAGPIEQGIGGQRRSVRIGVRRREHERFSVSVQIDTGQRGRQTARVRVARLGRAWQHGIEAALITRGQMAADLGRKLALQQSCDRQLRDQLPLRERCLVAPDLLIDAALIRIGHRLPDQRPARGLFSGTRHDKRDRVPRPLGGGFAGTAGTVIAERSLEGGAARLVQIGKRGQLTARRMLLTAGRRLTVLPEAGRAIRRGRRGRGRS